MTTEYTDDEFRSRMWSAYRAGLQHLHISHIENTSGYRQDFEKWFAKEYPEHTKNLSVFTPEQIAFIVEESLNPSEPNDKLKEAQQTFSTRVEIVDQYGSECNGCGFPQHNCVCSHADYED